METAEQLAALKGTRPTHRSDEEIEAMHRFAGVVTDPTRTNQPSGIVATPSRRAASRRAVSKLASGNPRRIASSR